MVTKRLVVRGYEFHPIQTHITIMTMSTSSNPDLFVFKVKSQVELGGIRVLLTIWNDKWMMIHGMTLHNHDDIAMTFMIHGRSRAEQISFDTVHSSPPLSSPSDHVSQLDVALLGHHLLDRGIR